MRTGDSWGKQALLGEAKRRWGSCNSSPPALEEGNPPAGVGFAKGGTKRCNEEKWDLVHVRGNYWGMGPPNPP